MCFIPIVKPFLIHRSSLQIMPFTGSGSRVHSDWRWVWLVDTGDAYSSRASIMIDCILFYVPLKNISLVWRRHHCRWRDAKFSAILGAQGLWAGRDLYRATPAVTRDLGFSGLIRRTALFSRLLRHTRGCGESILTRILTVPHSVASCDTQGGVEKLF
jgi:hypothetical protein